MKIISIQLAKFFSVTAILLIFGAGFATESRSIAKTAAPLFVTLDGNHPSLSHNGGRIAFGPEIGTTEVYDVISGKRIAVFKSEMSYASVLSADGSKIRVFSDIGSDLYDVNSGKIIDRFSGWMFHNGKSLGRFWVSTASGLLSKNITSDLMSVAFFVQPRNLSVVSNTKSVLMVGDLANGEILRELHSNDNFVESDIWEGVTITPDGRHLGAYRRNLAQLPRWKTLVWEVATGKILLDLPFYSYGMSLADDGSRVATRRPPDDFSIEVWDLKTGNKLSKISLVAKGKNIKVNSMAISPDGKTLVTARDESFYFWDTGTGKFLASQKMIGVNGAYSKAIVFSGDGKRIAVCTYGESILVWSVDAILNSQKK